MEIVQGKWDKTEITMSLSNKANILSFICIKGNIQEVFVLYKRRLYAVITLSQGNNFKVIWSASSIKLPNYINDEDMISCKYYSSNQDETNIF